jgi:hypothetical protein
MAATEAICFAEPPQLDGNSFRYAAPYLDPDPSPLWRYACLPDAAPQPLQIRGPRQ